MIVRVSVRHEELAEVVVGYGVREAGIRAAKIAVALSVTLEKRSQANVL
jgi:hypothetical protein